MDSKSGAQEDQMSEMLLFMEKLPPGFITGDSSMMDLSGDNYGTPPTLRNPDPHNHHHPNGTIATAFSSSVGQGNREESKSSMAAMREMIFRIAAMQPVHIDPESVKPPKRRNVKISRDPQSVAARHRRERISQRIRILQRLVPGGTKMDTASMLDEAIHYVKFLKTQVQSLERAAVNRPHPPENVSAAGFPVVLSAMKGCPTMYTTTTTQHGGFEQQYNYDSWMLN